MTILDADSDLVGRTVRGDTEAFGLIVRDHISSVLATAYALTGDSSASEDVAQETFLMAWQRIRQLQNPSLIRPWLCSIARNIVRSKWRSTKTDPLHGAASIDELPLAAPITPADQQAIAAERERLVWSAIASIREEYRLPLVLYYREQKSTRQVAEALEITEDAVRQRLARARASLRQEVAALVEETLSDTRPAQMLVPIIVAAVASGGSSALAAGAVAAGVAKAGSGTTAAGVGVASATGLAFAGAIAGPAIGIAGGIYAGYQELKRAKTPEEYNAIRKQIKHVVALVAVWGGALVVVVTLAALQWIRPETAFWLGAANMAMYVVALSSLLWVGNKKIKAIRGPDREEPVKRGNQRFVDQAARQPHLWKMNLLASYGGAVFGSLGWIFAAAITTGEFRLCGLTAGFGLCAIGAGGWASLRRPDRYWLHASLLAIACAGFTVVARPHGWSPQINQFIRQNSGWEWISPDRLALLSAWIMLAMGACALVMHWRGSRSN